MISAILFDMGGTLDSDGVHWLDRFYTLYTRLGVKDVPKTQIKEAFYWADAQAELDPAMKNAGMRQVWIFSLLTNDHRLGGRRRTQT
jgi:FMN phosphatase YigB (HAD superfamily)